MSLFDEAALELWGRQALGPLIEAGRMLTGLDTRRLGTIDGRMRPTGTDTLLAG
jgi:hypothetical protein